jgi:protein TonB
VAAIVVAAVYCGAALSMVGTKPRLAPGSAELAARIHADLATDRAVEMVAPPPPARPAVPPPAAVARQAAAPTAARPSRRHAPVAPAQAAAVITRVAPESPLDLTGSTFVTGGAASFPGGATAGAGRSTAPVSGAVDIHAPASRLPVVASETLARPVSLVEGTWACPWPPEADAEQIDEQTVVIRVRAGADGTVDDAKLVSDPGAGFGRAAIACARRARFQAARDRTGAATVAWSPPIRVHFTR